MNFGQRWHFLVSDIPIEGECFPLLVGGVPEGTHNKLVSPQYSYVWIRLFDANDKKRALIQGGYSEML